MEYSINIPQKKYDFLTLLGPLALFSSLLLFLIKKPSSDLLLPVVALSGMVLCWLKRTTGLVVSLCILSAIEFYLFRTTPFSQGIWQLIMGCSLALAFTVIAISREENVSIEKTSVEKVLIELRKELETAAESHKQLTFAYDSLKQEHGKMIGDLQEEKETLKQALFKEQESKKDIEKLLHENDEMKRHLLNEKNERQQEKIESETQLLQFQNTLNELKETSNTLSKENAFQENKINQLNKLNVALQKDNAMFLNQQKDFEKSQGANSELQTLMIQKNRSIQQFSEQIEKLELEKSHQKSFVEKLVSDLEAYQFDKENTVSEINALRITNQELVNEQQSIASEIEKQRLLFLDIENEKNLASSQVMEYERSVRKLEGMYKQLSHQFKEKSEILNATRYQLFHSEEKLLELQKEWEEKDLYNPSQEEILLQKHILKMEKQHWEAIKEKELEIEQLNDLIMFINKFGQGQATYYP